MVCCPGDRCPHFGPVVTAPLSKFNHLCEGLFWALSSLPLVYMSVVPVSYCFVYCMFVVGFELRKIESSLLLFSKLFWQFKIPWNSIRILEWVFSVSIKRCHWILGEDCIRSLNHFEWHCHLKVLSLSIHEHRCFSFYLDLKGLL